MYTNNALLFPYHVIAALRNLRGTEWQHLVERIITLDECHEEVLAFMLLLIRLNGCMVCETDSYRAMRGCSACASQTLRRYKGAESELIELYDEALVDIRAFAEENPQVGLEIDQNTIYSPLDSS